MNRFKLTLTILLTAALVVFSLPLQALAQSPQSSLPVFQTTKELVVKNDNNRQIDINDDWYALTFEKTSFPDRAQWKASFDKARSDGDFVIVQYGDSSNKNIEFYWTESKARGVKLGLTGDSYVFSSSSQWKRLSLAAIGTRLSVVRSTNTTSSFVLSRIASSSSSSSYKTFISTPQYQLSPFLKQAGFDYVIPNSSKSTAKLISPNFTVEVKNRTVQVQHIKEFDRIPGYENDKPILSASLWKCGKVVTNRDFNPHAASHEALNNVFGFVKLATDPLTDVANYVVQKIDPTIPALEKIPAKDRDRILWCSESKVVKLEHSALGSLFRYEIDDYGYYMISLQYLTEHRHSYNSAITPDYVYTQYPESNDKYSYRARDVVVNADGKTFSADTRNLVCDSSGFCEVPPDEKDCSYNAQGSWAKVVTCHIGNFMTGLGNFMKWLFIPDSLSVYNSFNTMLDNLKKSFGFVSLPFTLIPNIWSLVNQGSVLGPNCSTPPLTVFGASASIELCSWRQHFPRAWSFMQLIVQGGIALYFLWVLYRLLMQFFGVSVGDSVDDDSEYEEVRWRDDLTGDVGDWERRRK